MQNCEKIRIYKKYSINLGLFTSLDEQIILFTGWIVRFLLRFYQAVL